MNHPPTLIVFNGSCLRQGFSGISTYLRLLCLALEKHAPELRWKVAMPRPCVERAGFLPAHRILAVPGPARLRGAASADLLWDALIAAHVLRVSPDAVFHSPFHFWAPLHPCRLVITAHDCIEQRFPAVAQQGRLGQLHRRLCWKKARSASALIAVSQSTKNDLVSLAALPAQKIAVIHNWPGPEFHPRHSPESLAELRTRLHLPARYIAYLGGFRSYKNLGLLIAAWNRSRQSDPATPALVLGGAIPANTHHGFYSDIKALVAATSYPEEIILPGPMSDQDLPKFYAGAALFVSPSLYEGFGYPAVEAQACGAPVIVSDSSSYRALFPRASRFDAHSEENLRQLMNRALSQPENFARGADLHNPVKFGAHAYRDVF